MDPFIGEIILFGGNFAPRGWAFCEGQLLAIADNQALFSLFGTMYGGDGRTTFGLPDLRGRVPVGVGNGPGLSARSQGQKGGEESVTLTTGQMPQHRHDMYVTSTAGNAASPVGKALATESKTDSDYGDLPAAPTETLNTNCISQTGGGQAHDNMQPYLGLRYIVALQGVYPSRS